MVETKAGHGGLQQSQWPTSSSWNSWERDQQWHEGKGGLQQSQQKRHKGKGIRRRSRSQSANRKGKGSKNRKGKAKGKRSGLEESQHDPEHTRPAGDWKHLKEQEQELFEMWQEDVAQRERAGEHWDALNEEIEKRLLEVQKMQLEMPKMQKTPKKEEDKDEAKGGLEESPSEKKEEKKDEAKGGLEESLSEKWLGEKG